MTQTLTLRRPMIGNLPPARRRDAGCRIALLPPPHFAVQFIMPNLVPPVVRGADAAALPG